MSPELHLEDAIVRLDESGPVFVMGCPRSGTTYLEECLARLPDIEMMTDRLAPDRMMHILGSGTLPPERREDLLWSLRFTFWRAFLKQNTSRGEAVLRAVRGKLPWTEIRSRPARPPGDFLMAYREPFLAFAAEPFSDHFPKARFIHIVRDGRDCADSITRTYPLALSDEVLGNPILSRQVGSEIGVWREWQGRYLPWWLEKGMEDRFLRCSRFARYVWMWREMTLRACAAGEKVGSSRYLEIRYEDLCTSPRDVGGRLLDFLGVRAASIFEKQLERASTRSVGIHRRQPAETIREGTEIARDTLVRFGYEGA